MYGKCDLYIEFIDVQEPPVFFTYKVYRKCDLYIEFIDVQEPVSYLRQLWDVIPHFLKKVFDCLRQADWEDTQSK